MNLLDLAEPALILQSDDSVSRAASEMMRLSRPDALVFNGKEFIGILSAVEIVKKNIPNPQKEKVSSLPIKKVHPFPPESDPEELIDFILLEKFKSIPILSAGKYFTVPKLNLLKLLDQSVLKGKSASDVQVFPESVSPDDQLSVAHSILRETHTTIAVVSGNRAEGVIEPIDFLHSVISVQRLPRESSKGERTRSSEILSSSIMRKNPFRVRPQAPLAGVVNEMIRRKTPTVIVEDEKFRGIITPSSILKLKKKKISGILVRVEGQKKEDPFIRSIIDEQIQHEVRKLGKIIPIDYLVLHISRHNEGGKRVRYSIKSRLITGKGMFFAEDHSWDLTQSMSGVLKKLEKEVLKKSGKKRLYHLKEFK